MTETRHPASRRIRRVREILVHGNPFTQVFYDEVLFPDGGHGRHVRLTPTAPGMGAVVLPSCKGDIALVRTYRYALDTEQWALPRGFSHGGDPLETARAELDEEIGSASADFRRLGTVTPDSGLLSSRIAVFLAVLPEKTAAPKDTDEVLEVRWLPVREVWSWVSAGRIEDGFTLAALTLAQAAGALPAGPRHAG
jgi:ADP-ribose pyrophosphatase